jgi:hypothetical protein
MTKAERRAAKAKAVMAVAQRLSAPNAALASGVSAATVRKWRQEPEFMVAVAELQAIASDRSLTPRQMVDAVTAVMDRIEQPRRGPIVVTIPPGTTPQQHRRLVARAVAEVLVPGRV